MYFGDGVGCGVRVFLLLSPTKSIPFIRCLLQLQPFTPPPRIARKKVHEESSPHTSTRKTQIALQCVVSVGINASDAEHCVWRSFRPTVIRIIGNAIELTLTANVRDRIVNCINCKRLFLVRCGSWEIQSCGPIFRDRKIKCVLRDDMGEQGAGALGRLHKLILYGLAEARTMPECSFNSLGGGRLRRPNLGQGRHNLRIWASLSKRSVLQNLCSTCATGNYTQYLRTDQSGILGRANWVADHHQMCDSL